MPRRKTARTQGSSLRQRVTLPLSEQFDSGTSTEYSGADSILSEAIPANNDAVKSPAVSESFTTPRMTATPFSRAKEVSNRSFA